VVSGAANRRGWCFLAVLLVGAEGEAMTDIGNTMAIVLILGFILALWISGKGGRHDQ
jgi:hypothetical protein